MVKKPTTKAKKPPGRPPKDPGDIRSISFSLRLHPDLYSEISRLARLSGLPLSLYVEKATIAKVHGDVGKEILDAIGRYKIEPKR